MKWTAVHYSGPPQRTPPGGGSGIGREQKSLSHRCATQPHGSDSRATSPLRRHTQCVPRVETQLSTQLSMRSKCGSTMW